MQITRNVQYGQLTRGDEFLIDNEIHEVLSVISEDNAVVLWVRDALGGYHTQVQEAGDLAVCPVYGEPVSGGCGSPDGYEPTAS